MAKETGEKTNMSDSFFEPSKWNNTSIVATKFGKLNGYEMDNGTWGGITRCPANRSGSINPMMGLPAGTKIWLAAGVTDMRKGFNGLSALVQTALHENPFSGQLFVFRGRRGDRVKVLWWDGQGLCLFYKCMEDGKFVWPRAESGVVHLTPAQLSMLLEGIDWRRPIKPKIPTKAA